MLVRLHQLAQKLAFLRVFCIIVAAGSLCLTLYCLLFDTPFTVSALKPAIIGTLWGLLIFAFLQIFQTIPPPVLPHDSFLKKLSLRIKLALHSTLAALVITTTILLLWMSLRLLLM